MIDKMIAQRKSFATDEPRRFLFRHLVHPVNRVNRFRLVQLFLVNIINDACIIIGQQKTVNAKTQNVHRASVDFSRRQKTVMKSSGGSAGLRFSRKRTTR